MNSLNKRNHYCFGLGTIGRDMFYTMVSMYLLFYLTDILRLPEETMWWTGTIFSVLRIFDAVNDPFMGMIVDNTRGRYGKFKPWITAGALLGGAFMILMFTDLGLRGAAFTAVFAALYLCWDVSFGLNDIAYWSMLPALSMSQKQRERMGAFARICANIGLFVVVVGILPVTNALGGDARAWLITALCITALMLGFQAITVFGVKEQAVSFKQEERTSLKELFGVLFKNDQLMIATLAMALFNLGYFTTTSFGVYYFKYAYGDESMYSVFAAVLGVSQLAALTVFPLFSKRYSRRTLYTCSTVLVVTGYLIFFFSPMNMLFIGAAGVLIFVGQAFIQLLMLMFLADTIEYGQWKLGKRNESVTFSVQPFLNKIGGAVATFVVNTTILVGGIVAAETATDVPESGILLMKLAMLILPLVSIFAGYLVYRFKYKIDPVLFERIVGELKERGDIAENETQPRI